MVLDMGLWARLRELFSPNTPTPPEVLGADASDVIQANRDSIKAQERALIAQARHAARQDRRLRQLEERLERVTNLTAQIEVFDRKYE